MSGIFSQPMLSVTQSDPKTKAPFLHLTE